ncbi:hypothetical protein CAEBREN_07488 [Caenorhabditis brenneri]|uniref:Uncharacterized protein n=1 Tax=Caenorhabditis brenneri TaxID=135651 RepID=G0MME2_CAEBE|nr:hypothetical protein CAEBREN_07488 [Caenorhabditis brenneri]
MMRAQQSHTGYDAQNLESSPPPSQNLSSSCLVKESTQEESCRQDSRRSSAKYEAVKRENSPPSDPDTQRDSCSLQSSVVSSEDQHLINGLNKKQKVEAARDSNRRIPKDESKPTSYSSHEYVRNFRLRENAILAKNPSERTPEEQAKAERILTKRERNAEKARLKYHSMSAEEKKQYNRIKNASRTKRKRSKKTNNKKSKEVHMDCEQYSRQSSAEYEAVERENSPPSDHLECHFSLPDSSDTQCDSCSPQSSVVPSEDQRLVNRLKKKEQVAAAKDSHRRIPKDESKPTYSSRSEYDRNRRLRGNEILAKNPSERTPREQAIAERILAARKRNAEKAGLKYHSMSAEEKKQHNRMKNAWRTKRKISKKTTNTKSTEVHMDDDADDQESSHRHNQHDE